MFFFILLSLWTSRGLAQAPALAASAFYNAKAYPLSSWDKQILTKNNFAVREDGSVWAPGAQEAILESEMPFILQRLQGKVRLKALLAIELIYNRSDEGRHLSPEDQQNLKIILSLNWPAFSFRMRREFKKYFTPEERASLDKTVGPPSAIPPAAKLLESLPELPEEELPLVVSQPPKAEPAAAPAIAAAIPAKPPEAPSAPPEPPALEPPAMVLPALAIPASGLAPAEFEKFLVDAPYGREVKSMLKLISSQGPGFARLKALQAVVNYLPPIAMDSSGLGSSLRSAVRPLTAAPGGVKIEILISPGPAVFKRRSLLTSSEFILSRSRQNYPALGIEGGALKAFQPEQIPARRAAAPWGETQFYDDNSSLGTYSLHQQAGTLLYELVRLNARQLGRDGNDFISELFARSAQQMFYAKAAQNRDTDAFLDPEARRSFQQWQHDPWDYRDHLIHTLSSGNEKFAEKMQESRAVLQPLASELAAFEGKYWQEAPPDALP